jgi:predicted O-methyltransferase YrrM
MAHGGLRPRQDVVAFPVPPSRLPRKYTRLDRRLYEYVLAHRTSEDPVVADLRAETALLGKKAVMLTAPEQVSLLRLLARLCRARAALEIGTFTGMSALAIARGLAPGGRLTCCDVSEEWTSVARRYWRRAGVDDRITLRLGPALETLRAMPSRPTFDFVFLDADKPAYPDYWEEIVPRLLPGGLVVVDNVLRDGEVVRPSVRNRGARAIRAFNDRVASDTRVESVMIAVADGITLARRP